MTIGKHAGDLPQDTEDKLRRMQDIRIKVEELGKEYDALVDELLIKGGALAEGPEYIVGTDGRKYRAIKVPGSTPTYHYNELYRLTPEQREAITEVKISGEKLKQAIQTGAIPAEKALHLVSYKAKRPYAKFEPIE